MEKWGGGGGSLSLEAVSDPRGSLSEKNPERGFKGIDQKTPLTGNLGQLSHLLSHLLSIYEEFHRKTRYIHFGQFEIFEI